MSQQALSKATKQKLNAMFKISKNNNNKSKKTKKGNRRKGIDRYQASPMVSVNLSKPKRATPPNIQSSGKAIRIKHCETFAELNGNNVSNILNQTKMIVNPANRALFPWLSYISQGFQKFKIHKLLLKYIPSCPTTSSGELYFYPVFDPLDDQIYSFKDVMSNDFSVQGPVSKPLTFVLKNLDSIKSFLIGDSSKVYGGLTSLSDPLLINAAPAYIVFGAIGTNFDANTLAGRIEVMYDIELINHCTTNLNLMSAGSLAMGDMNYVARGGGAFDYQYAFTKGGSTIISPGFMGNLNSLPDYIDIADTGQSQSFTGVAIGTTGGLIFKKTGRFYLTLIYGVEADLPVAQWSGNLVDYDWEVAGKESQTSGGKTSFGDYDISLQVNTGWQRVTINHVVEISEIGAVLHPTVGVWPLVSVSHHNISANFTICSIPFY